MRIAISGAGVAGPALAYWLSRTGHEPVLIEQAPSFRSGGYVIDFWGVGYDVVEKMGVLPQVLEAGYIFKALRLVDGRGRKVAGMAVDMMRKMARDRFTSLPRGDLAEAVFRTVEDRVETLFGETITSIEDSGEAVRLTLESGARREVDMVVGADGLHSRVRRLAFGPQAGFETDLGYRVATFEVRGYRPRDELVYVARAAPGRQAARIALRDDRTVVLLVARRDAMSDADPPTDAARRAALKASFADMGWEVPAMLEAMEAAEDLYFDRVSQIRMPRWSKGRVALVGDAACAVSLLAGEGTGLALTEAYVLAGELKRAGGELGAALDAYEARLRPFVQGKQASAARFAGTFAPGTALGVWLRNQAMRLMGLPGLGQWLMSRSVSLKDDFELPDYGM